jgi:hypothetical protein
MVIALALAFLAGLAGDCLTAGRRPAESAEAKRACRSCPLLPGGERPAACPVPDPVSEGAE